MRTTGSSSIAIRNSNSCNEEDGEEMHRKNGSANALYRNCERGATSSRTQGLKKRQEARQRNRNGCHGCCFDGGKGDGDGADFGLQAGERDLE